MLARKRRLVADWLEDDWGKKKKQRGDEVISLPRLVPDNETALPARRSYACSFAKRFDFIASSRLPKTKRKAVEITGNSSSRRRRRRRRTAPVASGGSSVASSLVAMFASSRKSSTASHSKTIVTAGSTNFSTVRGGSKRKSAGRGSSSVASLASLFSSPRKPRKAPTTAKLHASSSVSRLFDAQVLPRRVDLWERRGVDRINEEEDADVDDDDDDNNDSCFDDEDSSSFQTQSFAIEPRIQPVLPPTKISCPRRRNDLVDTESEDDSFPMVTPPTIRQPPKPRRQSSTENSALSRLESDDVFRLQQTQRQRSLPSNRKGHPSFSETARLRALNYLEASRNDTPWATGKLQPTSPFRKIVPKSSPRRESTDHSMHQNRKPSSFSPTQMSKKINSGGVVVRVPSRHAASKLAKVASPARTLVPQSSPRIDRILANRTPPNVKFSLKCSLVQESLSSPGTHVARIPAKRTPAKVIPKAVVSPSPPTKNRSPAEKRISSKDSTASLFGMFATDGKTRTCRSVASIAYSGRKKKNPKPQADRPLTLRTNLSGELIRASTFTHSMRCITASNPDQYRIVHNVRECLRTATLDGAYYQSHEAVANNPTPATEKAALLAARKERKRLECHLAELRAKKPIEQPSFHKALRRIKTAGVRPSQDADIRPTPITKFLEELRKTTSSDEESSDEELWS